MKKKLYIPIDSKNLPTFFGCACIMPRKYFSNKDQDIQSIYPEHLLICYNMGTNGSDCALEVVLTDEETKLLFPIALNEDIFLFNKPLPISRIKSIIFDNEAKKEQMFTLINISTAFAPKELFHVIENMEKMDSSKMFVEKNLKNENYFGHLHRYNSLLGGFALMKLSGDENMNYSDNYFPTLAMFNSLIKDDLIKAKKNQSNKYSSAFWNFNNNSKLSIYLNKPITEADISTSAREENQTVNKNALTGIIDINSLERITYVLAVLYSYGVGDEARTKKIDSLILSKFKNEIKEENSEFIALAYGLNRGYSSFSNRYIMGEVVIEVKFKLDSKLNYYTIETLYQSAFNNITPSGSFPYLDEWCPKLKIQAKKGMYTILDEIVFSNESSSVKKKSKVGSKEYLQQSLRTYFQNSSEQYFESFFESLINTIKKDLTEDNNELLKLKDGIINELTVESIKNKSKDSLIDRLEKEVECLRSEIESIKNQKRYEGEPPMVYRADEAMEPYNINTNLIIEKNKELTGLIYEIYNQSTTKKIKSLIDNFTNGNLPFDSNNS